jgi:hypothetical protein
VRKRLLCGAVPSPDPNMLPPGSLEAPKLDPMSTTRQRFEGKMLPECRGCHGQFNDIGYVLEAYDSVGRYRTTEKIFDSKGAVLPNELPIDLKGVPKIDLADERPVNGPAELVQRIVESKSVDACMSKNFFEYALRRAQVDGTGDACAVEELVTELRKPGVSLGDVYKRLALQASFRLRKVGAQ